MRTAPASRPPLPPPSSSHTHSRTSRRRRAADHVRPSLRPVRSCSAPPAPARQTQSPQTLSPQCSHHTRLASAGGHTTRLVRSAEPSALATTKTRYVRCAPQTRPDSGVQRASRGASAAAVMRIGAVVPTLLPPSTSASRSLRRDLATRLRECAALAVCPARETSYSRRISVGRVSIRRFRRAPYRRSTQSSRLAGAGVVTSSYSIWALVERVARATGWPTRR
mmetsp:Transcript_10382/g.31964  ORF Transcript_10382/g.31964 Transcript_10382/m.31964 type:complete len:223 (+) Transcript_10382:417-1085(+)